MTKVAVLAGGDSDERDVSLRSGAAVAAALGEAGYEVVRLDPSHPSDDFTAQLKQSDVVFPVLHGLGGEDGKLQALLEAGGHRYIGADALASAHCFDKWLYKLNLQKAGISVPQGELVTSTSIKASELVNKPFVLKPYNGGSSVDTFIVRNPRNFDYSTTAEAFSRHQKMLLEELIDGQEITVAVVLGEALPVIEIIPPSGGEFDYENKYNGRTQELCPPKNISPSVQRQAQALALRIHQLLKIRHMSRTDIMVAPSGELYVLETNTIPGLTNQSLLPKAAATAGYSMPQLVGRLIESARTASL